MPRSSNPSVWQDTAKRLGANLRAARERLGLAQLDVAERMGTPRSQVGNIELGKINVTLETILKAAEAVETDPKVLLVDTLWSSGRRPYHDRSVPETDEVYSAAELEEKLRIVHGEAAALAVSRPEAELVSGITSTLFQAMRAEIRRVRDRRRKP